MGTRNLENYAQGVWSVVWPEPLGRVEDGVETEMKDAPRSPVGTAESGLRVQLMYHPSLIHLWPDREKPRPRPRPRKPPCNGK